MGFKWAQTVCVCISRATRADTTITLPWAKNCIKYPILGGNLTENYQLNQFILNIASIRGHNKNITYLSKRQLA